MKGTWQTTGGGGFSLPIGAILGGVAIAAVVYGLFLAMARLVADVITAAVIAGFTLVFVAVPLLVLAGLYRRRHGALPSLPRLVPQVQHHELPGPERSAIGQSGPREVHYHFHDTDPTSVAAEILRRQQRPE
jgi:endonuclease/exonuclease/phosphatase (EEP) superfamily protein YafD